MKKFTGSILGYDPGGNGSHGVALCRMESGVPVEIEIETFNAAEDVLGYAEKIGDLQVVGVDTLTVWTTAESGWRPADILLRQLYKPIIHSITSPNSLAGSMGLNGMAVLIGLKSSNPILAISETHPKVLYYALAGKKYDYANYHMEMDIALGEWLGIEINTKNDHEWDAVISVLAAIKGFTGQWTNDLHTNKITSQGRFICPCGQTSYWWPDIT